MSQETQASNVKDSQTDARIAAKKRLDNTVNQFRMLGNVTAWNLSVQDREDLATAIEAGAVELVDKLRGSAVADAAEFTFSS